MNLFRKMAGWFAPRPLSLTDADAWRGGVDLPDMVTDASVLSLSAAWACLNLLAGTIASLPLVVYRDRKDGGRDVASGHPLYAILHDSPNDEQTALDFWEQACLALELRGNAYAEKLRIGDRVVGLYPIHPDAMSVRRQPGRRLEYSWRDEDGVVRVGSSRDVLHIRGFGGDARGGISTLSHARKAFALASSVNAAAHKTFQNGLRPSGVITFEKFLTAEQRIEIEKLLLDKFTGAMNAGRPMILEGGTKWEQLTIDPEDAQMLESRSFSVEEIARIFGVPPSMIGHTEKSTSWGTGIEQQALGFQKFTLRRRLKRIEQALARQLLSPTDRAAGIVIEFNLEGLLRGDSAARASFYQTLLQCGVMTINEVRALENLPPVAGGDVPRMQAQNIPITQANGIGHDGGPPLEE